MPQPTNDNLADLAPHSQNRQRAALVIEDDIDAFERLERALTEMDWRVERAEFADEVRPKLAARRFDLLVVDWELDDATGSGREADGQELIRALRREGYGMPMIMQTLSGALVGALDAGANYHLSKPVVIADFKAVVRNATQSADRQGLTLNTMQINMQGNAISIAGRYLPLTQRDKTVLTILAILDPQPATREDLLTMGWNGAAVSPNLIEVSVSTLKGNLEAMGVPRDLIVAVKPDQPPARGRAPTLGWRLDISQLEQVKFADGAR